MRPPRRAAAAALLLALAATAAASAVPPDSSQAAPPPPPASSLAPSPATAPADSAARPAPPAVRRPAEWDTLPGGLPEEARFRPIVGFRYNRVDGPAPTLGAAFETARAPAPVLYASYTHAFSRERGLYEAGFEERIGDRPLASAGGSLYRRTATEDAWIVGETENTLFALFARTDYRDYYEAEGASGHAEWRPGSDVAVRAAVRIEWETPLRTRTRVSAFGREDSFRPNPPIERGNDRAYALTARIGPETLPARGGTHGEVTWERSGDPFHSDFDYGRIRAVLRTRVEVSPTQVLRARAIAGSTRQGTLPPHKIWYLGGIGTLRGHDYKELAGDQFFLANVEYNRRVRKNLFGIALLDFGAAWFGSGNLDRQKPALDGGIGLRLGEGPIALTLARDLRRASAPIHVGVRLGGSF